jgi:phosphohistidine swiveling domain-containing protein
MQVTELLREQVKQVHQYIEEIMATVTSEQARWHPPDTVINSLGGNYAHILVTEDLVINAILKGGTPLFASSWAGKTGLSPLPSLLAPETLGLPSWQECSTHMHIDLSALRSYAQATYAATEEYLASLSDEQLPPDYARLLQGFLLYLEHMKAMSVHQHVSHRVCGIPASRGRYEGQACIIQGPGDFEKLAPGNVLIAWSTSPDYNVVLPLLGAVVTDKGGALCNAATIAREFGIPAVVGTGEATTRIPEGARVVVDGDCGVVEVLA